MKITIGDLRDMRGADMPIILQDCKYVMGYEQKPIAGPWGWMVHVGDCHAMRNNDYIANDDMDFHFLYGGLDYVEVDTDNVIINCDGIFIDKPVIWVEPTETVEACETSPYHIDKAVGDGYDIRKWGECNPIAWYRTFEEAEYQYNGLNGWNN